MRNWSQSSSAAVESEAPPPDDAAVLVALVLLNADHGSSAPSETPRDGGPTFTPFQPVANALVCCMAGDDEEGGAAVPVMNGPEPEWCC